MRRWLILSIDASAIALALLAIGVYGFTILYGIDEGTVDPASARTLWGHIATFTYQALIFPFTLLFWQLHEELASTQPTRIGASLELLGFVGLFIDAWLYGLVGAIGLRRLSDMFVRRAAGHAGVR